MRFEPPVDHTRLIATVRTVYGLPVDELTFIPVGVPSVCYAASCEGGVRYFLKLWPATRVGRAAAARRDVALPLTRALYERGLFTRLPSPLTTRAGRLWATFDGASFAIFPFLTGHTPPAPWPCELWDELANTMAALHVATPALADVLPPRETFRIAFERDLLRGMARIAQIGRRDRPGLRALRNLVEPRYAEIGSQLARLHAFQDVVRRLPSPFVVCHTDMGGDNVLVDSGGQLFVLDWDDVILAPPEHDLHEARGGDVAHFLKHYTEAGGMQPLYLDQFAFYLLRRSLHDLTVRLLRILEENTSTKQDDKALVGIEAWGFAQWAVLDSTLTHIATALSLLHS